MVLVWMRGGGRGVGELNRSLKNVWKRCLAWALWTATHFGCTINVLLRGPLRYSAYQVNTDWVNAEKARYQEERAASGHTDSPPFVSTNDVLASWFFNTGG
jgi:hypothetical protein